MRSNKKPVTNRNWWTPIDGVPPKKCPICSRMFYINDNNKRKYCSDLCSYTSKIRHNMRYERKKIGVQGFIARRCPGCKLLFVTNDIRKNYCSRECKPPLRKHHPFVTLRCLECKSSFTTNNPRKTCCSTKCSQRFHSRKYHRATPMKKTEVCKHIYDTRDDPDSISDLIEDLTGIHCDRKIRDEKEDHRTESPDRGPWEINSTPHNSKNGCVICGLVRDKSGIYCSGCWKVMKKGYVSQTIKALGKMDVTIEQKRRCLSCRILPTCIEVGNVRDGCETIFKSLQDREAKNKIRSLAEELLIRNKEDE